MLIWEFTYYPLYVLQIPYTPSLTLTCSLFKWARIYFDASDTWFYGLNKKHKGLIKKIGGKAFVNIRKLNAIAKDLNNSLPTLRDTE